MKDPAGRFTSLVNATGARTAETLRKIATGELKVTEAIALEEDEQDEVVQ